MARKDNRKDKRTKLVRNAILGFIALIAVVVIVYGTIQSSGVTQGEFVAGEHYRVVEDAPAYRLGTKVEVAEFFSYGCIHCRNFDPLLQDWADSAPDDVAFSRRPVVFSPQWGLLAQAYYSLETLGALEQNHERLFRTIHENRKQFRSGAELADFFDGRGTDKETFLTTFNSPAVRRSVAATEQAQRTLGVSSVPTLVVANRYVINMEVGRKASLDVVDFLIGEVKAGNAP